MQHLAVLAAAFAIVVGLATALDRRFAAQPGASPVAIGIVAVVVGLLATFVTVQNFADLVPDAVEPWLTVAIAVGVSITLAAVGVGRFARGR